MRYTAILAVAAALFVVGGAAWSAPDTAADRAMKRATADLEKGDEQLSKVSKLKSNAEKLQVLDRALYFLRKAHGVVPQGEEEAVVTLRARVAKSLVRALDDAAEIYYVRKSLTLAQKRNEEARAINSQDPRAHTLSEKIAEAKETDIYELITGETAIQRIRDRRAQMGLPLRDRGPATRR